MSSEVYRKTGGAGWLHKPLPILILLGVQLVMAYGIATSGLMVGIMGIAMPIAISFVLAVILYPQIGFYTLFLQAFVILGLSRYLPGPWGLTVDGVLFLMYGALFFNSFKQKIPWKKAKNDLTLVTVIWYGYLLLQIVNPEAASRGAWFYAMRGLGLYMLLIIPLVFIIFDKQKYLNGFLIIWGVMSFLATLKGAQQLIFGVDSWEQAWLNQGAATTHILFGKLRVFSFYSDAGQFGAAQAHAGVVFGILALAKDRNLWLRVFFIIVALAGIYGMFISGTRGSIAVPVMGGALYFVLKKNIYVMVAGAIFGAVFFGFFKFTTIGNNIDQIRRMRTAFDPNDPSLQVRLENQRVLKNYMASRPIGGGVGSSGNWGQRFSPNTFLAQTPTDSWYVMVWAELGIVGLLLHLGILFYILGKSCYLAMFKIRDDWIRETTIAMACGMFGIMVASYGNGILGQFPTGVMIYTSMAFMFLSPRLDEEAQSKIKTDTAVT
jgi:hypothetical protein